jgi:hypothetical protein
MNAIFSDRITPQQVSEVLGVNHGTLSVWRCTHRYRLPYIKIGRKVFYSGEDIKKFIAERTFGKEDTSNVE